MFDRTPLKRDNALAWRCSEKQKSETNYPSYRTSKGVK